VIARTARDLGILTVGIVTKPFQIEGSRRMRIADAGIAELRKYVDTLIVIPNQNLFRIATEKTTFAEAFVLADQVLYSGVACIVDLIVKDGLINLDFADVRTVMGGMGSAMMGTGEATGDRRAFRAAEDAISNPLLDEVTLNGAKGVLLSIIGGRDMTLFEVDEAASRVRQEVDPEANIIVGAAFDEQLGENIRVAIVASGLAGQASVKPPFPGTANPSLQVPPMRPSAAPPGMPPLPGAAQGSASPFASRPGAAPPPMRPADSARKQPDAASAAQPGEAGTPKPSEPPRELWRSPTNVVIEEVRAPGAEAASGARPTPPREAPAPEAATRFEPTAPHDVRRPSSRRVPSLDEFPPVGQREYRAKAGLAEGDAPHTHSDDAFAEHDQRGRGGLLQRMIGTAKKSIRQ
jgi:cell division protein FtsZ